MAKKTNKPKLEGIDGWLYIYFIFCFYECFFLYGFLKSIYDILSSGTGNRITVFFFIIAVVHAILLVISIDLIIIQKKGAKLWSVLFLTSGLILFVGLLTFSLEEIKFVKLILFLIVSSLIWVFYFFQSERVKNTFVK